MPDDKFEIFDALPTDRALPAAVVELGSLSKAMTAEDFIVYRNLALCFAIVALVVCLAVVLCREWVKTDLRQRMCEPLRIRWRPFAWRTNRLTCSFSVVYLDFRGDVHRAICWTYWFRPSVTWDSDEIVEDSDQIVGRRARRNEPPPHHAATDSKTKDLSF